MKILTYTTLYPNSIRPNHGIFVENRLLKFLASCKAEARVVAPVPWFPLSWQCFGEYGVFAEIPRTEYRHNIMIDHPKFPVIPKLGMNLSPFFMAVRTLPILKHYLRSGEYAFDVIDAHYFYPDGVAAMLIGMILDKPVVITARGSDINLITHYYFARQMIKWAADKAAGVIAVCQSLKAVLVGLGISQSQITVLRNGVDLELFRPPACRESLRSDLNVICPMILSVGRLDENKGHDLVIRALSALSEGNLYIVGEGEKRKYLEQIAIQCGVRHRVFFLGAIHHHEMRNYYGAADVLVLASGREGWANVLLESMACGTPVVATDVGAASEVIMDDVGILVYKRTPTELATAIEKVLYHFNDRDTIRKYAENFSWDETSQGQFDLFSDILED